MSAGLLFNNSSIKACRLANVQKCSMIGGLIAPRCITFLRCLDRAEKNCHFRKAGGAICSDVTKNTSSRRAGLRPLQSANT